jgi:hypothetical protein
MHAFVIALLTYLYIWQEETKVTHFTTNVLTIAFRREMFFRHFLKPTFAIMGFS